jgi:hypothetical protein
MADEPEPSSETHTGRCLCGAVRFTVAAALRAPDACHCSQCRRQSGHYWASTNVRREALALEGEGEIGWYASSGKVRRGFCRTCGSVLFWDPLDYPEWIAIAMGAFDKPTLTRLELHIHVADKGDYYDIADGLPQKEGH